MDLTEITSILKKKTRVQEVSAQSQYTAKIRSGMSGRIAANQVGIARSTLRDRQSKRAKIPLSSATVSFFESVDGAMFLEQMVTVLQFVMTQLGSCGIRMVSLVLRLLSVDYFVASSYETLRERGIAMEENIVAFGKEERTRLAQSMPPKKITIAEDETYHHQPCLVAMEPVSNFILLERYAEKRDAASWNTAMDEALEGLSVEVIQSTSDEARGIINHVEQHLGAHHSPDVFHVQQEISRGTSAVMASKVRAALHEVDVLENELANRKIEKQEMRGRPSALSLKTDQEISDEMTCKKASLALLQEQQTAIRDAKNGISAAYHPYDLKNGAARPIEQVQSELEQHFETIKIQATAAGLRQTSLDKIKKAHRVCAGLVLTMNFFWSMVRGTLENMSLSTASERLVQNQLIPIYYLAISGRKAKTAELRQAIKQQSERLGAELQEDSNWLSLAKEEQEQLTEVAKSCAQLFQRSSSCLEGRNGYLSLRHHGLHHLSDRKLGALTVIHNYYITRQDKTTAAERFFNQKPRNLLTYLIRNLPSVSRPTLKMVANRRAA